MKTTPTKEKPMNNIKEDIGDIIVDHNTECLKTDISYIKGEKSEKDLTTINIETFNRLMGYINKNYIPRTEEGNNSTLRQLFRESNKTFTGDEIADIFEKIAPYDPKGILPKLAKELFAFTEQLNTEIPTCDEICICSAVVANNGEVIRGHRHGDCIQTIQRMGLIPTTDSDSQGFITSKNRFVTREEGRRLQDLAGIKSADLDGYRGTTLFSEDLYTNNHQSLEDKENKE